MFGKDDCVVETRPSVQLGVVPGHVKAPRRCGHFARRRPGQQHAFGSAVLRALVQSSLVCVCACLHACFAKVETSSTRPSCPRSRTSAEARLHGLCPAKIAHGMIMHRVSHKPGQPKQCGGCSAETTFQVRE